MNMMPFYKKRTFGELVNDSYRFFKLYGKNYFKNYFLIGFLVLILVVLPIIISNYGLLKALSKANSDSHYSTTLKILENSIPSIILMYVLGQVGTFMLFSFPIFYLKRLSESHNARITFKEIFGDMRSNFGRILKLFLGLMLIVFPALFIAFIIYNLILIFIVLPLLTGSKYFSIGIAICLLILRLIVPIVMNALNFLMYDYLITQRNFFKSLGYAIRAQFTYRKANLPSPFWKYWGTHIIISFINIFLSIIIFFVFIILIIAYFALFTNDIDAGKGLAILLVYIIYIVLIPLLMNIPVIASGLMYYDSRTDLQQNIDILEIDSIGKHDET